MRITMPIFLLIVLGLASSTGCTTAYYMPLSRLRAAPRLTPVREGVQITVRDYAADGAERSYPGLSYCFMLATNRCELPYSPEQLSVVLTEITEQHLADSGGWESASRVPPSGKPGYVLKPRLVRLSVTANGFYAVSCVLQPFLFFMPAQRLTGHAAAEFRLYDPAGRLIWVGYCDREAASDVWAAQLAWGSSQTPPVLSRANDLVNAELARRLHGFFASEVGKPTK